MMIGHQISDNSPKAYRDILQDILDKRKIIMTKSAIQQEALHFGAQVLDRMNESGAKMERDAAIVRYHSLNPGAHLLHDDYTRGALRAAIWAINIMLERSGEK